MKLVAARIKLTRTLWKKSYIMMKPVVVFLVSSIVLEIESFYSKTRFKQIQEGVIYLEGVIYTE